MAKMHVDSEMKILPPVGPGTIMIHKEQPPFLVMATGIVIGDEFPGVDLKDGSYGEQWVIDEYNVFDGKVTLEN